jgi:lipopolysaccharide/colanic/teichoic acid biosynthesis glycosyltransferase
MADGTACAARRTDGRPPHPPASDLLSRRLAKRCFDLVVATVAIVLLVPLLAVIACAVKRDSRGPVLFLQLREGYRRSSFTILKFRTMVDRHDPDGDQARRNDPRVTRIGRYLRAASFDELPQLFNVLLGHLSLVGPRPHHPQLSARFAPLIEGYYERLDARPGLTGLAQISGLRGETETVELMAARIRVDRLYVHTWTFWGDIVICFKTLLLPLGQDRAY